MDSLAALKSVLGRAKTLSPLVKEIREALSSLAISRLTLLHDHSHIGVEGNEVVDRIASDGTQRGSGGESSTKNALKLILNAVWASRHWLLQILAVPAAGRVIEVPPETEVQESKLHFVDAERTAL
eukprot:6446768-Amphidinium_carterae.2